MATDTDVTDIAPETGAPSPSRALRLPALGFWGVEALWLVAPMATPLFVAPIVVHLWSAELHASSPAHPRLQPVALPTVGDRGHCDVAAVPRIVHSLAAPARLPCCVGWP